MVAFSIAVTGAPQVAEALSGIISRRDAIPTALLRDTGLIIQSEVDQIFDSAPGAGGGAVYGGEAWVGLSAAYLKRRPNRASGQILRDTGELLQSLSVGGSGNILQGSQNQIVFGTSLPKAAEHQNGIPGRLPSRKFLFITAGMAAAVQERWTQFVLEGT
jgi:phage gpG-like protein